MTSVKIALCLLLLVQYQTCSTSELKVYVDGNKGADDPLCFSSPLEHRCKSLEYVHSRLVNSTNEYSAVTITVCGPTINLTLPLQFEKLAKFTLTGSSNETSSVQINCNRSLSGISWVRVTDIHLWFLSIKNCGAKRKSTQTDPETNNSTLIVNSALYILNCTNVHVFNVTISSSNGTGISLYDTNGTVHIENSHFLDNYLAETGSEFGGGAIHIEYTYCSPGIVNTKCMHIHKWNQDVEITIINSHFEGNIASINNSADISSLLSGYPTIGRGGGVWISFASNASNNSVVIHNCRLDNNTALSYGGGVVLAFIDTARGNRISINSTHFVNNRATRTVGGGLEIIYDYDFNILAQGTLTAFPLNNNISITSCTFMNNTANCGGGVNIYTAKIPSTDFSSTIFFGDNLWTGNSALTGAAVHILPGVWSSITLGKFPQIVFSNSNFTMNRIDPLIRSAINGMETLSTGAGTFFCTLLSVRFCGTTNFSNNRGTALYLVGSSAQFSAFSYVLFKSNNGINGGAISLHGWSSLQVGKSCKFTFENNTAEKNGGAILFNGLHHGVYQPCFIEPTVDSMDNKTSSFSFTHNRAGSDRGNDIYVTSFTSCAVNCLNHKFNKSVFECIGKFHPENIMNSTATLPQNFYVVPNTSTPLEIVPGISYTLPIRVLDGEGNNVSGVSYQAFLNSSSIAIDPAFKYVSKNSIEFIGQPHEQAKLVLNPTATNTSLNIDIKLSDCPPGYILTNGSCKCAASSYYGILKCDPEAYILHGVWMGYCNSSRVHNVHLCTGDCPYGYCSQNDSSKIYHPLPMNLSLLDSVICSPTRTGRLCGKCKANHSVYFNSWKFACGTEERCHYGALFYLLSNIIPLTVLFVIIIIFNINFTSGNVNGFILFAQILGSLEVHANDIIRFPSALKYMARVQNFVYRIFSLDFFSLESLSFCLWKGATVMDIMMMKYVTIGYAFALVVFTVLVLRWRKVAKYFPRFFVRKYTLIHGMSAFFTLCYAQCTSTCFQILTPQCLFTSDSVCSNNVVFIEGELEPFHGEHIKYATVAMLLLGVIVFLPPFLLLVYPLLFKILGFCKLSETKFANYMWRMMPIQLLDCFQNSFKDEYRFFAGLYFLYRAIALAAIASAITLTQIYTLIEIQLILVIVLHAAFQPYKEKKHNIIDLLLFSNLALINGIAQYNYAEIKGFRAHKSIRITATVIIQSVLISLPLVCAIFLLLRKVMKKLKRAKTAYTEIKTVTS